MLDTDKELMELFLLAYQRPDRMMNTKISISESAYSEFLFLLESCKSFPSKQKI